MKGAVYNNLNEIVYVEDLEYPTITNNQSSAIIKVHSCCLIQQDLNRNQIIPSRRPGFSISGVIAKIGENVKRFKAGDEIVAMLPLLNGGGLSEYLSIEEKYLLLKPKSIDFNLSSASLFPSLEAYTALYYSIRFSQGDSILILSGASAFGKTAIELSIFWEAGKILTTASSEEEFLFLNKVFGSKISKIICLYKQEDLFSTVES